MQFPKRHSLPVLLLAASVCAKAQATITFDNVTTQAHAIIPEGYSGFDWSNFYVASPALLGPPYNTCGYENGLISGQYIAFNGYANPSELSTVGNTDSIFGLTGYFTAAWTSDDQLTIEGLVNNKVVQSFVYELSETKPQFLKIHFSQDVSEIEFVTFSPTTYSSQMVLDNLTLNPKSATPEPESLLALGLGIGGFARLRRSHATERRLPPRG